MSNLIKSLPKRLKSGLTPAEEKLLKDIENNEETIFSEGTDIGDPKNANQWGFNRTIRAELLHWLCTNQNIRAFISNKGIQIFGAKIKGTLDFQAINLPFIFGLFKCSMEGVILMDAETKSLNFNESHIGSFNADELTVKGDVFLDKVNANGEVRLLCANISAQLSCTEAVFENPEGEAFIADGLTVKGDVFLDEVNANGEVRLPGANISGQLSCEGAVFENPEGKAFSARNLKVRDDLFLDYKKLMVF
ncbi:MAG: hypothetical protein HY805_02045 [Nitrospirae bacterium]|nr:hypothetical protein [Nitrospirota bacterium]